MKAIRTTVLLAVAVLVASATALADTPGGDHGGGDHPTAKPGTKMSIEVVADRMSGWNLFVKTKRFRWAPEHASGDHRRGEGHAHLAIDGKPITRLYGEAFFIPKAQLSPGRHEIRVGLASNDHRTYVDERGEELEDSVSVDAPESGGGH